MAVLKSTIPLEESEPYFQLLAAVEKDERADTHHDYRGKLAWVVARVNQYADATGLDAAELLAAWERDRNYWYMNYYQECKQPAIKGENTRVFETLDELKASIGTAGFRCPHCRGTSNSSYECDSGLVVDLMSDPPSRGPCNWKVYGLFGHLGRGVFVFVKSELRGQNIFMPIAWE